MMTNARLLVLALLWAGFAVVAEVLDPGLDVDTQSGAEFVGIASLTGALLFALGAAVRTPPAAGRGRQTFWWGSALLIAAVLGDEVIGVHEGFGAIVGHQGRVVALMQASVILSYGALTAVLVIGEWRRLGPAFRLLLAACGLVAGFALIGELIDESAMHVELWSRHSDLEGNGETLAFLTLGTGFALEALRRAPRRRAHRRPGGPAMHGAS